MSAGVRVCPDCGAEFHAHVAACSDCGTALVAPDALAPRHLVFHDDLVPVSYADGPMARRYADALDGAGIPSCAQWIAYEDGGEEHLLFVRPEDAAEARRVADAIEAPSLDLTVSDDEGVDEAMLHAAFEVPDVSPGPEEQAAIEAADWAVGMILSGVVVALLGAFVVDGFLGLALAIGGAVVATVNLSQRARNRARAAELRVIRERTPTGLDPDSGPARLDDGPTPIVPGV